MNAADRATYEDGEGRGELGLVGAWTWRPSRVAVDSMRKMKREGAVELEVGECSGRSLVEKPSATELRRKAFAVGRVGRAYVRGRDC